MVQRCKTIKIARKIKKNKIFENFDTPGCEFSAPRARFLVKFQMPVTPEQIIKEGCWTPEMKDLIEYFKGLPPPSRTFSAILMFYEILWFYKVERGLNMEFFQKKNFFALRMPAEGRKTTKTTLRRIIVEPRVFYIFPRFFKGVFIMPRTTEPNLNKFGSTNIFWNMAGQSSAIFWRFFSWL